jgi:hypothetical protein
MGLLVDNHNFFDIAFTAVKAPPWPGTNFDVFHGSICIRSVNEIELP